MSQPDGRAGVWRVVFAPRVAVRSEPSTSGRVVGSKACGTELRPLEAKGAWLRIGGESPGWILSDGTAVGLGPLLERLDTKPLLLHLRHPVTGAVLPDVTLPGDTLVSQATQELADRAGLPTKLLLACNPQTMAALVALNPQTSLWEAGFREGDNFAAVYTGQEEEEGGPAAPAVGDQKRPSALAATAGEALQRLELGTGTSEDIQAAVAGGWQREAIQALLAALVSGSPGAGSLAFAWAMSPRLGKVEVTQEPTPGCRVVLLLGWGGSSVELLEGPRRFWQDRGCTTIVTTRCPFEVEEQATAVARHLVPGVQLLVHSFSNNGLYFMSDLFRHWNGDVHGLVIDSAPDPNLKPALLRQVANGCIRALCAQHAVQLREEEDQALATIELVGSLREGDVLVSEDRPDVPVSVLNSEGKRRGWLLGVAPDGNCQWPTNLQNSLEGLFDRPLGSREASQLSAELCVAEADLPDLTGILDLCRAGANSGPAPVLFLYSRTDTLIKASAVEAFMQSSAVKGSQRSRCFEGSAHIRHFDRHREAYTSELQDFSQSIGF